MVVKKNREGVRALTLFDDLKTAGMERL